MAGDFGTQSGKRGPAPVREPFGKSAKPSAGITNESNGNLAPTGPGPGVPPNGKRIS